MGRTVTLNSLKKSVSITAVLADKGLLPLFKRQADRLVGPCPIHVGDNPNAFVISLPKNLWYCFTGCNTGGDIVDLVRKLDGKDYRQTLQYLKVLAGCRSPYSLSSCHPRPLKPFVRKLPLDHSIAWLRQKKITSKTAALFEVGAYYGRGFLADSIGIRLHDVRGAPIGYAARRLLPATIKRYGKYQFPPAFPKSTTLYNYHRISRSLPNRLVITECPWGVMRLHQLSIPAVALLGIQLSMSQYKILEHIKDIVLMLDGDDAGRQATRRIKMELRNRGKNSIHSIWLPTDTDPDDLTDDELRTEVSPFFF